MHESSVANMEIILSFYSLNAVLISSMIAVYAAKEHNCSR